MTLILLWIRNSSMWLVCELEKTRDIRGHNVEGQSKYSKMKTEEKEGRLIHVWSEIKILEKRIRQIIN